MRKFSLLKTSCHTENIIFLKLHFDAIFLYIVAKRRSLFDDKSVEIQELTYIIKEDINGLNQDIAKVRRLNAKILFETLHTQCVKSCSVLFIFLLPVYL